MNWESRHGYALAGLGGVLAAAYYTYGLVARFGRGFPGYDVFAYSHPNFVYARRAFEQGHGLFWNDLQHSGQPFFSIISTGLLSPVNVLSFVLDPDTALNAKLFVNASIAAIGMLLLCREIGLGPVAALCGALAFVFGGGFGVVGRTCSFITGSYVWVPAAMFLCERVLRAPAAAAGVGLGVVLTLQLLAGFPQISLFTYQLIAARACWHLATNPGRPQLRRLAPLALGLMLTPLLAAVQLVPSLEFLGESIRGGDLSQAEINPLSARATAFEAFRSQLGTRTWGSGSLFPVVGMAFVGSALVAASARRIALFYVICASVYFALALIPSVYAFYEMLPLGQIFRGPTRFLWMTSFVFSVVVACGADALSRPRALTRNARVGLGLASFAALAALYALTPTGFRAWEWGLVGATIAIGASRSLPVRSRVLPGLAVLALLAGNVLTLAWQPMAQTNPAFKHPKPVARANSAAKQWKPVAASVVRENRWAFEAVAGRSSEQDRMYQMGALFDFSLSEKSASVFGVASIDDYEPQAPRRYAELFTRMLRDRPMRNLIDFYNRKKRVPTNRPLLDLLATRHIVVDRNYSEELAKLRPPLRMLEERGSVAIYENPQALPRAFFVPRVELVADPEALLERLASLRHRPRQVALVEEAPADGFLGLEGGGRGDVEITASRSEELLVRVNAPRDGFLFVSDQYFPGWKAWVDGAPTQIQRANYAFRLVRVPQGESRVEFRYRPVGLHAGVSVTLATVSALLAWVAVAHRRAGRAR